MPSQIFYGAGNNAAKRFDEWVGSGLNPVCFADTSIQKHYTVFKGLKVLPLLEAIAEFPDYELYCTQVSASLGAVTDFLLRLGVPLDRIKYCIGFRESMRCDMLDSNYFVIDNNPPNYSYCCMPNRICTGHSESIQDDYANNKKAVTELRDRLDNGYYTRCDGCVDLKPGKSIDLPKKFNLSTGLHGGNICNFKCCYCTYEDLLTEPVGDNVVDVLEVLKFIESEFDPNDVDLTYACGEICVSKYRDQILQIWENNKWKGLIATNASVYLPTISSLMKRGLVSLNVSLDAGTKQTFHKVKGLDIFEKVVNNIKKYYHESGGGRIQLKYIILLGINDNESDVEGFIKLAAEVNGYVILSSDNRYLNRTITDSEKNAANLIIEKCKINKLEYEVSSYFYDDTICELR